MDPEACIKRLSNAIAYGENADAVAAIGDYYQWRLQGGFEPLNGDERVAVLVSMLADELE